MSKQLNISFVCDEEDFQRYVEEQDGSYDSCNMFEYVNGLLDELPVSAILTGVYVDD